MTRRRMTIISLVILGCATPFFACRGKDKQKGNPCTETARDLFRACQSSAADDYWTEVASCNNLSDPKERDDCLAAAKAALGERNQECEDQSDARLEVCDSLGGAAYDPKIVPANFTDKIDNPLMPLAPGSIYMYEKKTSGGTERTRVEVTSETKEIVGVPCVVVKDTVTLENVVIEDTLDFFSQDKDGNVWYFGEISQQFEDGDLIDLEGSWKTGRDHAKPGIIMEAHPKVGDLYRQEFSPGVAEDLAQVLSIDENGIKVTAGPFDHCLLTNEFTPLEPDVNERKYYAASVGNVLTIDVETGEREELVSFTIPK